MILLMVKKLNIFLPVLAAFSLVGAEWSRCSREEKDILSKKLKC